MNARKLIINVGLICTGFSSLFAQTVNPWDFQVGFGFGMTASGLPSQLSNEVAKQEKFIEGTENHKGFPFGTSLFVGTGYRFNENWSLGFEYGFGYNSDIGRADVKIGSVVPDYVMNAFDDLIKKHPEFGGALGEAQMAKIFAKGIYPGMTAKNNTVKGSYLDQKFLLYGKWTPNWGGVPIGFQLGTGLKMMHALTYTATQSKNPKDYLLAESNSLGVKDLDQPAFWNMTSVWASKPVNIPFPLKTKDGKVFMNKNQMLFNTSFRFNVHMFYMDVDYATEFKYIHNTKVTVGVIFDANILDSFLKK